MQHVQCIWKIKSFILKLVDISSFQKQKQKQKIHTYFFIYFQKIDSYDNEDGEFKH